MDGWERWLRASDKKLLTIRISGWYTNLEICGL